MIHGITVTDYDELILKLNCSKFNFHVTGSHFFGNAHKDSDLDLFVQAELGLIPLLESYGFVFQSESQYKDTGTMAVFHHRFGIHVQVVRDASVKNLAQEYLKAWKSRSLYWNDKRCQTDLWNLAISIVTSMMDRKH